MSPWSEKRKGRAVLLVTRRRLADDSNSSIGEDPGREFVELVHLTKDFTIDEQVAMRWPLDDRRKKDISVSEAERVGV